MQPFEKLDLTEKATFGIYEIYGQIFSSSGRQLATQSNQDIYGSTRWLKMKIPHPVQLDRR